jgi:hypothetical protein
MDLISATIVFGQKISRPLERLNKRAHGFDIPAQSPTIYIPKPFASAALQAAIAHSSKLSK